jgi:hypothetical protein
VGVRAATPEDAAAIAEVCLAAARESWGEDVPAIDPPEILGGELVAEDALRGAGCTEVSLWTEERNASARRVDQASGWRKTAGARDRVWNGVALRELRYRKRL